MWCVLQCRQGEEEKLIETCKRNLSARSLRDAFVFTCERMRRYEGAWHTERKLLFPGNVFLETSDAEQLQEEFQEKLDFCEEFGRLLDGSDMLFRVSLEEEAFLRGLCGEDHHMGMSVGFIREGTTHVERGPLQGMERRIRKIDRHKRIAWVEMPGGDLEQGEHGSLRRMTAGLEIVRKD